MEEYYDAQGDYIIGYIVSSRDVRAVEKLMLLHGVDAVLPEFLIAFKDGGVDAVFLEEIIIMAVHRAFIYRDVSPDALRELFDEFEMPLEWVEFLERVMAEWWSEEEFDPGDGWFWEVDIIKQI